MEQQNQGTLQINIQYPQCVVVGDHTTIHHYSDVGTSKKNAAVLEVVSKLRILPGRPFHKCFVRNEKITEVESKYSEIRSVCGEYGSLIVVYITGPPGSGKTQLARQFGEHFSKDTTTSDTSTPPITITLNVNGLKSLFTSLKELLDKIGLSEYVIVQSNLVKMVEYQLEELRKMLKQYPGKWLLIFDNLFCDADVMSLLPRPGSENWGHGNCIITTQDNNIVPVGHINAGICSLKDGMIPEDAYTLLADISCLDVDEFAKRLAKDVEYFPLSLACCATYVRQMNTDLPDYSWKKFYSAYNSTRSLSFDNYIAHNIYPYSMVISSHMAVARLAETSLILKHTFIFLSYCSMSPVPLCLITNFVGLLLKYDLPEEKLPHEDEISAEILRCSCLSTSSYLSVTCITFHQVTAASFKYVRDKGNLKSGDQGNENVYNHILVSLNTSFKHAVRNYDTYSVGLKVLSSPHLKTFLNYGDFKNWNKTAEFVIVLANLSDALYHVPGSTQEERVSYIERAHSIAKKLSEPMTGIAYCRVLKTLGFYYREIDRLEESVTVLTEAIGLTKEQSGESWLTLKSSLLNVIGWAYKLQNKLQLAEECMKGSIELITDVVGEQDERIIEILCNLAIVYREKYELQQARETVDKARLLAGKYINEWHLNRAQAANYSAKIYLRSAEIEEDTDAKQKFLLESLEMHAEALRIYERVLGEDHIYIAGVCGTYAITNMKLNALKLALKQIERSEKIYEDVQHIELRSALRYKTEILLEFGDKAELAEETIQKSIEMSNCGRARFLLARVYTQQKKYSQALPIVNEILTRWKSGILPKTHFWIKEAEELKWKCQLEYLKMFVPNKLYILAIAFLLLLLFAQFYI